MFNIEMYCDVDYWANKMLACLVQSSPIQNHTHPSNRVIPQNCYSERVYELIPHTTVIVTPP